MTECLQWLVSELLSGFAVEEFSVPAIPRSPSTTQWSATILKMEKSEQSLA